MTGIRERGSGKMVDPEIMAFGLRILDWCNRKWPYALMTPEQMANKKYGKEWVEKARKMKGAQRRRAI